MEKHFLLCTERSGSNLITKILNAHSLICGPSTKHIMNPVLRNIFRYEPIENSENWKIFIEDVLRLFNVEFSIWKKKFTIDELLNNVTKGDYIGLINYFFEQETLSNNKKIVFIKENHTYEFFPYLLKYFSSSKFIYQVRDPRDVALSWKKNPTHKGGIVNASKQWKNDQQQLLKMVHFLSQDNRVHQIKYEELILDTPKCIKDILTFLDLEYEPLITEFYKDSLTQKNSTTQDAWGNLSKSIMTNNSEKFLNELTKEEIIIIEKICFNEMKFLNYNIVSSMKELNQVSNKMIEDFKSDEEFIVYNPSSGVKENMKAKKIFYERNLNPLNDANI